MKVDGKCHCGVIEFRAEVIADRVQICHCADCQTLSGSAFRTVVPTVPGSFQISAGEPKRYVKTAASGRKRIQAFCPECGTPLFSASVDEPTRVSLRVGAIRQRDTLRPTRQIWRQSAQPWIEEISALDALERQ